MSHLEHHNNNNTPTSTRDKSTTMDPIQAALEAIDSYEEGASFSYRQAAKRFNVSRATLTRRHKGKTRSNAEEAKQRMYISPQHKLQPVQYIQELSARGLPPTRSPVRNSSEVVAKKPCSER
jgi:hypothetical protein